MCGYWYVMWVCLCVCVIWLRDNFFFNYTYKYIIISHSECSEWKVEHSMKDYNTRPHLNMCTSKMSAISVVLNWLNAVWHRQCLCCASLYISFRWFLSAPYSDQCLSYLYTSFPVSVMGLGYEPIFLYFSFN